MLLDQLVDSLLVVKAEDAELLQALWQVLVHVLEQAEHFRACTACLLVINGSHLDLSFRVCGVLVGCL